MYVLCNYNIQTMRIAVIPIGNSKGIRLEKSILEKYKIKDAVANSPY